MPDSINCHTHGDTFAGIDRDAHGVSERDSDPNRDRDAYSDAHLHPNANRNADRVRHRDAGARAVVILSDRLAVSVLRQVSRTFKVRLTCITSCRSY